MSPLLVSVCARAAPMVAHPAIPAPSPTDLAAADALAADLERWQGRPLGVTTDRLVYAPGETVFARVWDVDPVTLDRPASLPAVTLSLVDAEGRTVSSRPWAAGVGAAKVPVPRVATTGEYVLRVSAWPRHTDRRLWVAPTGSAPPPPPAASLVPPPPETPCAIAASAGPGLTVSCREPRATRLFVTAREGVVTVVSVEAGPTPQRIAIPDLGPEAPPMVVRAVLEGESAVLAQRLVWREGAHGDLRATVGPRRVRAGQEITVRIVATDSDGRPAAADLSVAVADPALAGPLEDLARDLLLAPWVTRALAPDEDPDAVLAVWGWTAPQSPGTTYIPPVEGYGSTCCSPVFLGPMSEADVRRTIADANFSACWRDAAAQNPAMSGVMVFKAEIDAAGATTAVRLSRSEVGDADIEGCIADRWRRLTFPPTEVPVRILWPFRIDATSAPTAAPAFDDRSGSAIAWFPAIAAGPDGRTEVRFAVPAGACALVVDVVGIVGGQPASTRLPLDLGCDR